MEVSGQLHDLDTLSLWKMPPLLNKDEVVWAPKLVWILWRRDKSLATARALTMITKVSNP
jgi:hypothetical protein